MRERARAMRQRVLDRATHEALSYADLQLLDASLSAALSHRDSLLPDDHDIDALHPARSVLILMDDARVADPVALAAAALMESERPDLDAVATGGCTPPDAVRQALARMPSHKTIPLDVLLESLLPLEPDLMAAVLSERLDHARHLHLRARELWRAGLEVEEAVYLPLAARYGGLIERRYARWHRAFTARIGAAG
jgi:hypothetical protein